MNFLLNSLIDEIVLFSFSIHTARRAISASIYTIFSNVSNFFITNIILTLINTVVCKIS